MPAVPTILGYLLWVAAVVVYIINPRGIRRRVAPYQDRFLERLPPSSRLAAFALLMTLGACWIAMSISFDGFWSFVQTPLGWTFGSLFWAGLIIVCVVDLTTRKQ